MKTEPLIQSHPISPPFPNLDLGLIGVVLLFINNWVVLSSQMLMYLMLQSYILQKLGTHYIELSYVHQVGSSKTLHFDGGVLNVYLRILQAFLGN